MATPNNIYASGTPTSNADLTTLLKFSFNAQMLNINTVYVGEIQSVNQADNLYSVTPIVNPLSTSGTVLNSPTVYDVPAVIIQGGVAGIIIDYQIGDIVLVGCCNRDSTTSISTQSAQNPATSRKFNISDSVIIGKVPTSLPSVYVHIKNDGDIILNSTGTITANCTTCDINATTVNLGASATKAVLLEGVTMTANIGGVQAGGGVSGVAVTVTAGGSTVTKSL